MTGIYKIETDKVNEFVKTQIIRSIIIFSLIILFFVVYTFFKSDILTSMIIGISLSSIFLLGLTIGIFTQNRNRRIYNNFELEILDDKIIRKGTGFYKIELKYEEIGRIFMKQRFLIVLKKGVDSNISYYLRKVIVINSDIIVIPDILSDFDKVKDFIESKRNSYSR